MNQKKQTEEVGVFEGYVDGEPLVKWLDRSRMLQPGDKLYFGAVQDPAPIPEQVAKAPILATWPKRIWLQHGCEEMPNYAETRGVEDGITWREDNIDSADVEYVRADLATQSAKQGAQPDLHDDIMRLPCKPGRAIAMNGASKQAYQEGHRDARHAAAELVAAAQASVEQATGAKEGANASLEEVRKQDLYTCIDKGGEYELLGEAYGAGITKGSVVSVYRDTTTMSLFYRTVGDFGKRMMPVRIDRASTAGAEIGGKGGSDA